MADEQPKLTKLTDAQRKRFLAKLDELWPVGVGVSEWTAKNAWRIAREYALAEPQAGSPT